MLNKFFKLDENNTDLKTELLAGLTTFLAMAYILGVNPNMLAEGGMPATGVFFATALASGVFQIPCWSCSWYGYECIVYLYNYLNYG